MQMTWTPSSLKVSHKLQEISEYEITGVTLSLISSSQTPVDALNVYDLCELM